MIRLLLASLLLASTARAQTSCPADRVFPIAPAELKKALQALPAGSERVNPLLKSAGLAAVPGQSDELGEDECLSHPVVEGVDVFPSPLTGPKSEDVLLQVRIRFCKGDARSEFVSQRIAVLTKQADGSWCRAEGNLDVDQAASNAPCTNPAKLPRTLAFANVTDGKRKTIVLKDQKGRCMGNDNWLTRSLAYADVKDGKLAEIFRIETDNQSWDASAPPTSQTLVAVTPKGGFPKWLQVTKTEKCLLPPASWEPPPGYEPSPCKETRMTGRFTLVDGKYQEEDQ